MVGEKDTQRKDFPFDTGEYRGNKIEGSSRKSSVFIGSAYFSSTGLSKNLLHAGRGQSCRVTQVFYLRLIMYHQQFFFQTSAATNFHLSIPLHNPVHMCVRLFRSVSKFDPHVHGIFLLPVFLVPYHKSGATLVILEKSHRAWARPWRHAADPRQAYCRLKLVSCIRNSLNNPEVILGNPGSVSG